MHHKRIISIIIVITVLLLLPLLAMQFTDQVDWNLTDFMAAAVFLLCAGLSLELLLRSKKDIRYKIVIGVIIGIILLLAWIELAVGIFYTPWAGS